MLKNVESFLYNYSIFSNKRMIKNKQTLIELVKTYKIEMSS